MIPQMIPYFNNNEAQSLQTYMESGGFLTEFKQTEKFEQLIAEFTGTKNAIVVNNGTVSLSLMLMACEIGPGDEVIVPNYTMIATPNSVISVGARPVFVDVEESTLCLDLEKLIEAITPNTKAIMFVTANGRYPSWDIAELEKICEEREIILLEDAAQSLGSIYPNGKHMGTVGLLGSFSFSVPKIITTGQGGCVVTNNDELAFKLRRLKDFGRARGGTDIHDSIGYNFKFTDLQACIGVAQMGDLENRVIRKKDIWKRYKKNLTDSLSFSLFDNDSSTTTPWFIDGKSENRDSLMSHLESKNIKTRSMYPPINAQKAYSQKGDFPVSEEVGRSGLWLPSFVQISDSEIDMVCDAILTFKN
jgi:perosamine synthetase